MSDRKPFKDTKLGTWITSNVPSVIGAIENFVPAPVKGGLDLLKNLINNDPKIPDEKKIEFAKLADDHELEMIKEANDLTKAQLDADQKDAADARNREIQIANSDKAPLVNKIATPVLALLISLAFFWLLGYLCKYEVPKANQPILFVMLGSLGTAWLGVVGYYFHTSLSSSNKDAQIAKMINAV